MEQIRPFRHLVEFDRVKRLAVINRVFDDGSKVLYVEISISAGPGEKAEDLFRRLAQRIGEDIVLDSKDARSILEV